MCNAALCRKIVESHVGPPKPAAKLVNDAAKMPCEKVVRVELSTVARRFLTINFGIFPEGWQLGLIRHSCGLFE